MSEHSPGPWSYGKCWGTDPATGKGRETNSYAAVDGGDGYIVATIWGHSLPGPTVLANARLIASAPELLAALKEVVRISDRKHDAWDAARSAIAKAEGGGA